MSWKQIDLIQRSMALADVLAAHDAIEQPNRSTAQIMADAVRLDLAEQRLANKYLCSKQRAHKLGYEEWLKTQPEEEWPDEDEGPSTEGAEGPR